MGRHLCGRVFFFSAAQQAWHGVSRRRRSCRVVSSCPLALLRVSPRAGTGHLHLHLASLSVTHLVPSQLDGQQWAQHQWFAVLLLLLEADAVGQPLHCWSSALMERAFPCPLGRVQRLTLVSLLCLLSPLSSLLSTCLLSSPLHLQVFGEVIDGLETLDEMERAPVGKKNRPVTDIRIKSVTIHANPFAS